MAILQLPLRTLTILIALTCFLRPVYSKESGYLRIGAQNVSFPESSRLERSQYNIEPSLFQEVEGEISFLKRFKVFANLQVDSKEAKKMRKFVAGIGVSQFYFKSHEGFLEGDVTTESHFESSDLYQENDTNFKTRYRAFDYYFMFGNDNGYIGARVIDYQYPLEVKSEYKLDGDFQSLAIIDPKASVKGTLFLIGIDSRMPRYKSKHTGLSLDMLLAVAAGRAIINLSDDGKDSIGEYSDGPTEIDKDEFELSMFELDTGYYLSYSFKMKPFGKLMMSAGYQIKQIVATGKGEGRRTKVDDTSSTTDVKTYLSRIILSNEFSGAVFSLAGTF